MLRAACLISANLFPPGHSMATTTGEGAPFDTPPAAATQGKGAGKAFEQQPPHPE